MSSDGGPGFGRRQCWDYFYGACRSFRLPRPVSCYVSVLALLLVLTSCFTLVGFAHLCMCEVLLP